MSLLMGARSHAPESPSRPASEPDGAAIRRSEADPEAFITIFERHFDAIHRYVHRRLGRDLADELASETFVQAYRRRGVYDARSDSALPWLYGIAANLVRRHRRTEVRRLRAYARSGVDEFTELDVAGVVHRADAERRGRALADGLSLLSADDRETLTLVAFADLTYEEVGRALGVPTGTVASRMNRVRRQLSSRLSEQQPSPTEEAS